MSIYKSMFEQVLKQKFGSGFTYNEWYAPNTDTINYSVDYNNQQKNISIDGLTILRNSGESLQPLMRQLLDKEFS